MNNWNAHLKRLTKMVDRAVAAGTNAADQEQRRLRQEKLALLPGHVLSWMMLHGCNPATAPEPLRTQIADAFDRGNQDSTPYAIGGTAWRGDWFPISEGEHADLVQFLEANQARIDADRSIPVYWRYGRRKGEFQYSTSCWNLLIQLKNEGRAAVEAVEIVRALRDEELSRVELESSTR